MTSPIWQWALAAAKQPAGESQHPGSNWLDLVLNTFPLCANCTPWQDLALLPNATTGLNTVLASFRRRLGPGDAVFSLDVGYGSVKKMIQVLAEETGAQAVQVGVLGEALSGGACRECWWGCFDQLMVVPQADGSRFGRESWQGWHSGVLAQPTGCQRRGAHPFCRTCAASRRHAAGWRRPAGASALLHPTPTLSELRLSCTWPLSSPADIAAPTLPSAQAELRLPLGSPADIVSQVAAALPPNARLAVFDAVTSNTALLLPLRELVQLCHSRWGVRRAGQWGQRSGGR